MIFFCSAIVRTSTCRTPAFASAFSTALSRPPTATTAGTVRSTRSLLRASFLDELTRTFSGMTTGETSKYYTVGITGAGGLIGTAFQNELSQMKTINGKPIRIVTLKRGNQASKFDDTDDTLTSATWNPNAAEASSVIDPALVEQLNALVHLSGENVSTGQGLLAPLGIRPWTESKKKEILDSRTATTSALAKAIAASNNKSLDFLVASGVGAYGKDFIGKGVTAVDESVDISQTDGFLAEVSRQWEASAEPAVKAGNRVVNMRNGVVLSTKGGVLAKLYPVFFLGGGGIVGSGEQYFPYISGRDMAKAMVHVMKTPKLKGPVNMCAPDGCTNAEFTAAMGSVLNRPTILPLPGFAVSLLFGEMGEELLLGGVRATPKKLLDSGFSFSHPTIEAAVQSAIDEKDI
ncbi:NAD(P)-dependent epimerase/dehydratase family protein [Nitzschia inconspicua]|uniref:NAD(P)-dependent epimerase/dehydratase family protein n=1 Tax=Nitzschia inconspicua TaxID=303405 RepID=A0A9K3Q8R4_9STRA|nr:NAD(P)-dependent epimerase/dehydratase family protein [Nitzschia inconspicua]